MHALVVVPGRPLGAGGVQEEGAHVFRDAGIDVRRAALDALSGTGRGARPGRFVPSPYGRGIVRHLHNHGLLSFF